MTCGAAVEQVAVAAKTTGRPTTRFGASGPSYAQALIAGRVRHTAVWNGEAMILWGG